MMHEHPGPTTCVDGGRAAAVTLRVLDRHGPARGVGHDEAPGPPTRRPGSWARRYGARHRFRKVMMPGSPDGRVGRVTVYERGDNVLLRWRESGKSVHETVRPSDHKDVMAHALRRAAEINRELEREGRARTSFRRATVREACDSFLAGKEASPDCSAATVRKYTQELARICEFAETTPEGGRCGMLHELDTTWCEDFVRWLDALRTTRNGGRVTARNPERPLGKKQKHGIRQRPASVVEHAILRTPPFVPPGFRNPVTKALVGTAGRGGHRLSEPPVALEELVAMVGALDSYSLGLLAPLFLFGPRPSELGRILHADYDAATSSLRMVSRPKTGFLTKGRRDKTWPVNAVLAACLRPLLERSAGPLFVKRWCFEGKASPGLARADEAALEREFEDRQVRLARELGRSLTKAEVERVSRGVWTDAGAVTSRDVRRELGRAAREAGLKRTPAPVGVRHLFESLCEEARLAQGVIRHLMGHAPGRGDALFNYNHVSMAALREQVAVLDERRKPLLDALFRRACELAGRRPRRRRRAGGRAPGNAPSAPPPSSSLGQA